MAQYDDLNVSRIAIVGVISVIVTAVTALAVQVLFYAMAERTDAAKAEASDFRRQRFFLESQQSQLDSYGVDPLTGQVTIPVEQAIGRILAEQKSANSNETAATTNET